jgi:hypothetical protein
VAQHAIKQGDLVYAARVDVDGVYQSRTVWVVVTDAGLVRSVSDPPIGSSVAAWPALVHLATEPT